MSAWQVARSSTRCDLGGKAFHLLRGPRRHSRRPGAAESSGSITYEPPIPVSGSACPTRHRSRVRSAQASRSEVRSTARPAPSRAPWRRRRSTSQIHPLADPRRPNWLSRPRSVRSIAPPLRSSLRVDAPAPTEGVSRGGPRGSQCARSLARRHRPAHAAEDSRLRGDRRGRRTLRNRVERRQPAWCDSSSQTAMPPSSAGQTSVKLVDDGASESTPKAAGRGDRNRQGGDAFRSSNRPLAIVSRCHGATGRRHLQGVVHGGDQHGDAQAQGGSRPRQAQLLHRRNQVGAGRDASSIAVAARRNRASIRSGR